MIAKAIKGTGFRGALEYDVRKDGGRLIASNMAGTTPRELAMEFGAVRQLRPNLHKAVLHVSLSAAPGERLTDTQWRQIADRYLQGMGFTDNQYVVTRHSDTEHEHVHIVCNRITMAGGVVSDSQDYQRQERLMREIELEFGLQPVVFSREAPRKAATKGEIERNLHTGQPSTRQQLQQLCDAAAQDCDTFAMYVERLEAVGVELVPVVQLKGTKLSGLSYRLDGVFMKGSDLGRSYAAAGIQKRGIRYEQDRDIEAVRRCLQREATRAFDAPDRAGAPGQAPERGGPGGSLGAAGASYGGAGRRDPSDPGADRAASPRPLREFHQPVAGGGDGVSGVQRPGAQGGRADESLGAAPALETGGGRRDDGRINGGARDRIVALGAAASGGPGGDAGLEGRGPVARAGRDRSLEAVRRQIAALGEGSFVVGVRDAKSGLMMLRDWSAAEVEGSLAWLKRMNARGNDIYIRPAGDHGFVLVDDLSSEALARMQQEGYAPAAVIETSPGNYQAWLRLSPQPLPADLRTHAARGMAKRYGADMNSADARHFGRLAGFTNQKPQHTRAGRQPYVLARACPGTVALAASAYLGKVMQSLEQDAAELELRKRLDAIESIRPVSAADPVQEYRRQAKRLLAQYGAEADLSRVDWMIAIGMAKSGRFAMPDIQRAIEEGSPNVDSRKSGHVEDYAKRTAERAWAEAGNAPARPTQPRQAQRDRGADAEPDVVS